MARSRMEIERRTPPGTPHRGGATSPPRKNASLKICASSRGLTDLFAFAWDLAPLGRRPRD